MANVVPIDVASVAQTRILVDAIKETVAELKSDVREVKAYRFKDLLWHMGVMASGFILLAGLMLTLYWRLDDKLNSLSTNATRVETKVEMMMRRPPADAVEQRK